MLNFQGVSHYLQGSKYPSVGAAFLPSTDIFQASWLKVPGFQLPGFPVHLLSVAKSSHAAEQVGSKNSESSGVNSPVDQLVLDR